MKAGPLHNLSRFPSLETPRLWLRRLELADAAAYFRLYSDPRVMRFWNTPPHRAPKDTSALIVELADDFRRGESIRWAITLKPAGHFVGDIGLWPSEDRAGWAEVGCKLVPEVWSKGYMREALDAVVRYGFAEIGLPGVEAEVSSDNRASIRLVERLGFRLSHHRMYALPAPELFSTAPAELIGPRPAVR